MPPLAVLVCLLKGRREVVRVTKQIRQNYRRKGSRSSLQAREYEHTDMRRPTTAGCRIEVRRLDTILPRDLKSSEQVIQPTYQCPVREGREERRTCCRFPSSLAIVRDADILLTSPESREPADKKSPTRGKHSLLRPDEVHTSRITSSWWMWRH